MESRFSHNSAWTVILPGIAAGSLVALLSAPIEFIKVQRQTENVQKGSRSKSFLEWYRSIKLKLGYKGFYSGFSLHLIRDGFGTAIYFSVYETCKLFLPPIMNHLDASLLWAPLLSGGLAGSAVWLILHPIDLLKSAKQRAALDPLRHTTLQKMIQTRWQQGGFKPFYNGLAPTIIRSFPIHAVNFLVYERVLSLMGGMTTA